MRFLKTVPLNVSTGEFPIYAEVLCPEREALIKFLKLKGIQTRPAPPNLSISNYLGNPGSFPNSEVFAKEGIYLPCGPAQSFENIDCVIEALKAYQG